MTGDGEDKCLRCGRCCYWKKRIGESVVYTNTPCQYFDLKTKLCTVYDRRHEVQPACLTRVKAIGYEVLPEDCPYVVDLPGYWPPAEVIPPPSAAQEKGPSE